MSAPKVTQEDVDRAITAVTYVVLPDGRTTICMLTLDNGFTVRGESSCVCAENFNAESGQQYALEKAKDGVWQLLGFRLADQLAQLTRPVVDQAKSLLADIEKLPPSTEATRISIMASDLLRALRQ